MSKKEIVNIVTRKKTSVRKKVVKAILVITAVKGAFQLISLSFSKKKNSTSLLEGEYHYDLRMQGMQLSFQDQEVKRITISAIMSGIDMDLRKIEDIDGLRISFKGWMSGLCIRVPENVVVKSDLKSWMGGIANSVPSYVEENLPTIYISGKASMSGVDIRVK